MKEIKQEAIIPASPMEVYKALMEEKQHSKITGASAKIENKVGGKFSVWDGYASGENLELDPGKKIVQSWRASDWPEGTSSEITINLSKHDDGTKLSFLQTGVPDDFVEEVKQGWIDYYWSPLKKYFNERTK